MNKEETDLIIAEQNKSTEEILKAVAKVKSDYHELCKLKDIRIAELTEQNTSLLTSVENLNKSVQALEKENAELRKVAEFQQSSNMSRHFENKKLKEGLAVGSTFNKALNSMNKNLIEERDKYRNMVFDKDEHLTKAKDHIKKLLGCLQQDTNDPQTNYYVVQYMTEAEQFLKENA